MRKTQVVVGVLGWCRVCVGRSTHLEPANYAAYRGEWWVCWVFSRARAGAYFLKVTYQRKGNSYASTEKPNKPNTLNTTSFSALYSLVFSCVGFVLGAPVLCWVRFSGEVAPC